MRNIKYFCRRHRTEIITLIAAIAGYCASYFFIKNPGYVFAISILITLVTTIVIIYSRAKEKDFYFLPLNNPSGKEDWIGHGTFQYDIVSNAYEITNSMSGFLFSKCITWSDYKLTFDFKILRSSFCIILRATNLSNYVMLQIFEYGIKTHIRINGMWQMWSPDEQRLTFNPNLSLDNWYKCFITCNKNSITIKINQSENIVFDRVWEIPSGFITYEWPTQRENDPHVFVPFPITLEYGTIGIRNNADEKGLVKNVLIEKIKN